MSKSARVRSLSRPTSIYRCTPSYRAVRHKIQQHSRWPDTLVAQTGHAKLDWTRWSRNWPDALVKPSSAPASQWSDALLGKLDTTEPASGWSLVSSHNDRTRPVDHDRTRHDVRSENRDTRERWALTGCVRSNRDRVQSPLWPSFASVWFTLSHMS
jgi:hypothetical protein